MLYRVAVNLQDISGLPRDQYESSFYFWDTEVLPPIFTGWATALKNFYGNIANFLSPQLATSLSTIKVYRMADTRPRAPIFEESFNPFASTGAGSAALPAEVACCLSLQGPVQPSPVKPQSYRGRIFVGPLATAAMSSSTGVTKQSRPDPGFIASLYTAAVAIGTAINTPTTEWVIRSEKQHMLYPVVSVSVDDAWDTMRSRGDRPTARSGAPMGGTGGSVAIPLPAGS
jgi:hypothetical protein